MIATTKHPFVPIDVVDSLDDACMAQVKRYVRKQTEAGVACGEHDPRWLRVLHESLGHRPMVLLAHAHGDVVGYLPLALVASRLFGRFLVSLPYLNRAGVVADDDEVAAALIDRAVKLAEQEDVDYLELRHGEPIEHEQLPQQRSEKVRMVLELEADRDAMFTAIKGKVRNQVRKGEKADLTIAFGGESLVDEFYDVFAVNMRDLGTPVYPRKLFANMVHVLPDKVELAVARHEGKAVAGAVLVHDAGVTAVPSASCLREANGLCANMWMYFELIARAIDRGAARFDFGRSSEGSGTYKFKKQWGAEPTATVWQYHVRRGALDAARPDNPKYRKRIETWQKLPVWVTRLVGPRVVRGIP